MTLSRVLALLCLAPIAVRLHESAHVAAARVIGWRARAIFPDPITLNAWGSRTEYDADAATWGEHAVVSLAGPAASLAWIVVVVLVATVVLPSPWGFAVTPAVWFALRAVGGCSRDIADARDAIGCALASALNEEVEASTMGIAAAAMRLACARWRSARLDSPRRGA